MRDARLVQLFERYRSRGDAEALAKVFDEVAPALLKVARHIDGRTGEAEDLVQTTFLVAIERASVFDSTRPLVPWLMGILINQSRLARRRRTRIDEGAAEEKRSESDLGLDLEHREFATAVGGALRELPEVYQQVLLPHLTQGMKPGEIADLLGRPHGTVRAQIHRGIRMIRRILPAGFALGTAAMIAGDGSLGSIREEVLQAAREAKRGGARSSGPPRIALGPPRNVLQKCALATVALMLGLATWMLLREVEAHEPARVVPGIAALVPARERVHEPDRPEASRSRTPLEPISTAIEAEPYGEILLCLNTADGAPAAGRRVTVLAWGEEEWYARVVEAETDADGQALFARVHAGRVGIHVDHGQQKRETVVGGQRLSVSLEAPRGLDVLGHVVDRDGRPVAGALLETWHPRQDTETELSGEEFRVVSSEGSQPGSEPTRSRLDGTREQRARQTRSRQARSRSDGSYLLADVDRQSFVFARADGHAGSELYWLGAPAYRGADEIELVIVLSEEYRVVSGRVLDPRGAPVAAARVTVTRSAAAEGASDEVAGELGDVALEIESAGDLTGDPRRAAAPGAGAGGGAMADDARLPDRTAAGDDARLGARSPAIAPASASFIGSTTPVAVSDGGSAHTSTSRITDTGTGTSARTTATAEVGLHASLDARTEVGAEEHRVAQADVRTAMPSRSPARSRAAAAASRASADAAAPATGASLDAGAERGLAAPAADRARGVPALGRAARASEMARMPAGSAGLGAMSEDGGHESEAQLFGALADSTPTTHASGTPRVRCCADGTVRVDAAPLSVVTDTHGRFRTDGFTPGSVTVLVEAPGFAPWWARLDGAYQLDELIVHLTHGVALRGTVRLAGGSPAEGAAVTVHSLGMRPRTARADATGAFALDRLAPGAIELEARAHGFGAPTSATFLARDGESLSWHPVVEPERVIEGTVLGADDRPIAIWLVKAVPEGDEIEGRAATSGDAGASSTGATPGASPDTGSAYASTTGNDAEPRGAGHSLERWLEREIFGDPATELVQCWTDKRGRFRVPCRGQGPHRLELRPRMGWEGPAHATLSGVRPGARDALVRYAPSGAWARGEIVPADSAGAAPCHLIAIAARDGSDTHVTSDARTGAFTLGPLPEGTYEFIAWPPGGSPRSLGRHELTRGTTLDVGVWRLAHGN